jgi:hypothetical protein
LNSYEIKATDLLLKVNGDLPFDYDIEVKNGIAPAVPFIESAIYHAKITAENLVIEIN